MVTLGLQQATATPPAAAWWVGLLACAACASAASAAEAPAQQETFRWHGELVALDEGARELTVKARLTSPAALTDMPAVEAGDSIFITWAGLDDRAHGIRAVTPDDGAELEGGAGRFVIRAEFVSLDPATRYLTFRAAIPSESVAAVRMLARGDWATVTSPHSPAADAFTAVAAYAARPSLGPGAAGTYRWHGELVALDESARTLTVRARVATPAGLGAVAGAEADAPIVITWSGFEDRANGIRSVAPDDGSGLWGNDGFLLRANLVAADPAGRYLTFKAAIPHESVATARTLTRGDWATVTSPHWPTEGTVATVAAYDAARPSLSAGATGTYGWHGELLELDEDERQLTVRARVAGAEGLTAIAGAEAGAPIVITWSGFEDRANGIRSVVPDDGSGLWGNDGFLLRAHFVASDPATRYLTFKTAIPGDSVAAVRTMTRGDWATVTSPHWPTDGTVAAVATYDATRAGLRAAAEGTYRWHGELVALDEGTQTLTVRARVAARSGFAALAGARTGKPVVITWSGFGDRASAIRAVVPDDGSGLWGNDGFLLQARLVAADSASQYVTFATTIPESSMAAVRTLSRGDWATVTSSHWPGDGAVASIAAYDAAQAAPRAVAEGTYRWHGELVALDEASRSLTVRARVAAPGGLASVAGAQTGDPIVITWSGFGDRANDIRAITLEDGSGLWGNDGFLLRAEFVALDPASNYITFKATIPENSVATVRALMPGDWATVTSPHWPTDGSGAVVAVDAYDSSRRARRYVWPGELVAYHRSEAAATVSAPVESHVFRYVDRFDEGDAVVLIWAPGPNDEVTAVRYLEHRDANLALDHGYVLPVEFVSADVDRRRITFKTKLPATLGTEASMQPGHPIRVTSPFEQKGATAAILSVE